jgi:hypothetical protein
MSSQWHWRDLVTDHKTGKLRETAIWANIGKAAMTFGFLWVVTHGASTEWLWLTFGGVVVLHELGARHYNQAQQKLDKEPSP